MYVHPIRIDLQEGDAFTTHVTPSASYTLASGRVLPPIGAHTYVTLPDGSCFCTQDPGTFDRIADAFTAAASLLRAEQLVDDVAVSA